MLIDFLLCFHYNAEGILFGEKYKKRKGVFHGQGHQNKG
jgi:hypothetical protein